MNHNLFTALRAAFPKDLDAIAIETADVGKTALYYSWRDLDRATAMLANLLQSLVKMAQVNQRWSSSCWVFITPKEVLLV